MKIKKSKIGGAALILLGLLFIVLAWGGHFQSRKVMHEGGRAVAKVIDKKIERSRPGAPLSDPAVTIDYNVYYTFKTNEGKNIDGRYAIRKGAWDNVTIGDSIEVSYAFDNPDYNFPVGEGSLVPAGMPIALSVLGVMAIVVGGFLFRGKRLFQQKPAPASGSSEDGRILRLLDKIISDSVPIAFGSYQSSVVFSTGHFLEIADTLPAAIDALRDLFADRLSEDSIKHVIPVAHEGRAERVQAGRKVSGTYQISTRTHACIVDEVYYDYLKMRYPRAEVFCRGPAQPVTFYQDGILRAVLMPIKG
jgi:hypothetical protein